LLKLVVIVQITFQEDRMLDLIQMHTSDQTQITPQKKMTSHHQWNHHAV
nr:hypothetical protein [Tanacetum cinerariifolium]